MKKILWIVVLGLLLSGKAYAGVNEPGVTSIKGQCAGAFKHYHKKHIEKSLKKIREKKNKLCSLC